MCFPSTSAGGGATVPTQQQATNARDTTHGGGAYGNPGDGVSLESTVPTQHPTPISGGTKPPSPDSGGSPGLGQG